MKGSVELAPLTGMVDAIVDLSDTGTTLRENRLVELEELFTSTARLIANPVSHKLKAGRDRRSRRAAAGGRMKLRVERFGKDARAEQIRALVPPPRAVEDDVRAIVEAVRADGDAAVRRLTARFDHAEIAPHELRVPVG